MKELGAVFRRMSEDTGVLIQRKGGLNIDMVLGAAGVHGRGIMARYQVIISARLPSIT